jgi:UDP-N-acetylmuramyl pentapeptide phosphotransferase/UDP-N-acetylglucosamine-1-phosphate transferase
MQNQVYLAAFCFTLTGALMGFLWYNAYPAQLIHGRHWAAWRWAQRWGWWR